MTAPPRLLPRLLSLALSIWLVCAAAACDSGAHTITLPDLTPPAKEAPAKDAPKDAAKPQQLSLPALPALPSTPPAADAAEASPAGAGRALVRAFSGFLRRDPLGFDQTLPASIAADGLSILDAARLILLHPPTPIELFSLISPVVLLLLLLLLLSALDHSAARIAHTWQARLYLPSTGRWASDGLRALVLLIGRVAPLAILSAASFLTFNVAFGQAVWVSALVDVLLILLGFRALSSLIEIAYGLDPLGVPDEHAFILRRFLNNALIFIVGALASIQILKSLGWRPELHALLLFALRVGVALLPIYLLSHKTSALALLPERSASRSYLFLRHTFAQNYNALLGLTVTLLGLRALGYSRASTFILVRGYGLFLLLLLAFNAGAKLRQLIDQRIASLPTDDPQLDSLSSIRSLSTVALITLTADIALELLALHEPLILLLRTPILQVQQITFSAYNALSAAIIVSIAVLLSQLLRYALNARVYPALKVEVGVAYAINTLISYAVLVIGFFLVLVALGVNLSALTVVLASLSVGIGFGLQTMTENLIAGFIILFGRAVRKGDYVTIEGTFGRVEAVGARSVIVRTPDNVDLLVPSKALVASAITNWTYRDSLVRLHIPVAVSYDSKPRHVEQVLLDAATRHEHVLTTPPPEVWFKSFRDSAIEFELLVYFDCRKITDQRLAGQLHFHIWDALEEANIEIPFPQRDLHIRSAPGLQPLIDQLKPHADKGDAS
jgi:small-conductance mechanosensitive channel